MCPLRLGLVEGGRISSGARLPPPPRLVLPDCLPWASPPPLPCSAIPCSTIPPACPPHACSLLPPPPSGFPGPRHHPALPALPPRVRGRLVQQVRGGRAGRGRAGTACPTRHSWRPIPLSLSLSWHEGGRGLEASLSLPPPLPPQHHTLPALPLVRSSRQVSFIATAQMPGSGSGPESSVRRYYVNEESRITWKDMVVEP